VDRRASRCLLNTSLLILVVGSFDEFAVGEGGAGADQGHQVGCVDHPPPGLGRFDELERHRHPGGAGAGAFGDPLPEPDGGEGRLDRVGGS
jgi:hypothetical protein